MEPFQMWRRIRCVEHFGIHPFHVHFDTIVHAAMCQRLFDRLISVFELNILADDRNVHFAISVVNAICDVFPNTQVRFRGRGNAKCIQYGLV